MIKCSECRVSNCTTKLNAKGTVCGKHRWRMKKFGSYDLPGYTGVPNYYVKRIIPEGYVHECNKHGFIKTEDTYCVMYKGTTPHYKCKRCIRDKNISSKYQGMQSTECYEKMLKINNNVCSICKNPNTTRSNNKNSIKGLSIDHCHTTGKVRGLLCCACNSGLGYFKDSTDLLLSAIMYLKCHQEE